MTGVEGCDCLNDFCQNSVVAFKFLYFITKTCPCNIEILALKIENFQLKKFDIFLIIAKNTDCGYTLEQPTIYVLEQK